MTPTLLAPPLRPDGLALDQPLPGHRSLPRHRSQAPAPVAWWQHPWVALAGFVLTTAAVAVTVVSLGRMVGAPAGVTGSVAQLVAVVAGYLVMLRLERRRRPLELRWGRGSGLLAGLLGGALLVTVCWVVLAAMGLREVTGADRGAPLLLPLLQLGLVAGVSEEILFRGVFHRLVERWLGSWGAALTSGALFGMAHLGNPHGSLWGAVAIAVEAGLLFGVLYTLTRSLWVVIGVHAGWNLVQGPVLGSVVSGSSAQGEGLLVSQPVGHPLLSGGSFGIEASLVTVVLLLGVSVALAVVVHRRGLAVRPSWRRH